MRMGNGSERSTIGFKNTTILKLSVEQPMAIIKSQDLGKQNKKKRIRFYENNRQ